ncbi:MAG: NAD-dependent epimerase/dehydratase family protein [Firmicutes bacterium]|nr:NAD-dependent epimerase/dehydratase family protein [Bacillota bacterium]
MIVITGSTGHIGNNFARLCLKKNIPFKLLARRDSEAISDMLDYLVQGDIFDPVFLKNEVHQGDILVHFAAFIDIYDKNFDESMYVNDFGTRIIFDFCKEFNIRLLYASSVDVITRTATQMHICEPVSIHPELQSSNYAFTKASSTKVLMDLIERGEIQASIVYPTAVIGTHDYKPSRAGEEILTCLNRHVFFYVDGGYNFIDVEDVSAFCLEIVQKSLFNSYILGGHNIKVLDFYRLINKIRNKKGIYIKIPKWLAFLVGTLSKKYSKVMMQAVYDNYHYDLSKMEKTFTHQLTPFEDTVSNTIDWFKRTPIKKK